MNQVLPLKGCASGPTVARIPEGDVCHPLGHSVVVVLAPRNEAAYLGRGDQPRTEIVRADPLGTEIVRGDPPGGWLTRSASSALPALTWSNEG